MKHYSTFLLDLDGVVYRGDQLLPGAREFVAWLDASGKQYRYLSNNSMQAPGDVAAKLRRLGIPAPDERVITASYAACRLLAHRFPGGRVWIVGMQSLRQLAATMGLHVLNLAQSDAPDDPAQGPTAAQAVLVGLHRAVNYEDLRLATRALLAGANFITVNRDPQLPVEDGLDPGCGAICAALEVASRRTAEMVGKPAPALLLEALAEMDADPATAVMIGDGIALDIHAGQAAGIDTILVLSGITSPEDAAQAAPPPTYVLRDLAAVLEQQTR